MNLVQSLWVSLAQLWQVLPRKVDIQDATKAYQFSYQATVQKHFSHYTNQLPWKQMSNNGTNKKTVLNITSLFVKNLRKQTHAESPTILSLRENYYCFIVLASNLQNILLCMEMFGVCLFNKVELYRRFCWGLCSTYYVMSLFLCR